MGLSSRDEHDFRDVDPPQPARGVYVLGLERTVLPEDMDGRRLKTDDQKKAEGVPEREKNFINYIVSIDVGARHDRTALSCVELRYRQDEPYFITQGIKRLRLGIPFVNIARQTRRLVDELKKDAHARGLRADITVLIDQSGIGEGVGQLVSSELSNEDVRHIQITAGASYRIDGSMIYVSKGSLISSLVAAFESGHIILPKKSREIDVLRDELASYEARIKESTGNESWGSRPGKYDDILMSLAMVTWYGSYSRPMVLF